MKVRVIEVVEGWDEATESFNGEFTYTVEAEDGKTYEIWPLIEYTMLGEGAKYGEGPNVGDSLIVRDGDLN